MEKLSYHNDPKYSLYIRYILIQHFLTVKFCATTKKLSRTNDALARTCQELREKSSEIDCVIVEDR